MGSTVLVGVVGKPFGLDGEVHVHPDADLDHDFAPGTSYAASAGETLVVASSRVHANRLLLRFEGVHDRDSAEALRGLRLHLHRDQLPLADNAYWTDALLGREVVDVNGSLLGVVEAFTDGPAHDYLVLARPDGGEVLVPAVEEMVHIEADRIVLSAPPGLLDLGHEPGEAG